MRSRRRINNKKILFAFGTRPEAIKLCPLIGELEAREGVDVKVCVSSQHKELLYGVLDEFFVRRDDDLDVMRESQTLFDITSGVLVKIKEVLSREAPDVVVVHGDTTTAFAVALACFYLGIPVAHVEAGLRTKNIRSPFPEEFNRRAISLIAKYHFAPTDTARDSLASEGIADENIFITGNTIADALHLTLRADYTHPLLDAAKGKRIIFLTAHRRENISSLEKMLTAIARVAEKYKDVCFIYPVHPNPTVKETAERMLCKCDRVVLCPPLSVSDCHNILARSYIILTDSGGLQEEAAVLHVPVLIMRDTTERPEGIESGIARLVGTSEQGIFDGACALLDDAQKYKKMSHAKNPYGYGGASREIAEILLNKI